MKTILSEIIDYKKREVLERKKHVPLDSLMKSLDRPVRKYSLCEALKEKENSGIIAEYKSKSPSSGVINNLSGVAEVTRGYITAGATALSILTDSHFFGGSLENLRIARMNNTCPILEKDFIVNEYQIYEANAMGADVILLIASVLSCSQVESMSKLCKDLGMESILEIHSRDEIDHVCPSVNIVGINNRDLRTFEVNITNSIEIARYLSNSILKISESGIKSPEDVKKLSKAGFSGFLIGSSFMKSQDPAESCRKFISELKNIRQ
ncbi:MAG TPA: indole-3-glycerol phosphate synthase TrpC [Bacteroidales bacterium]|nr:indole-3-glycerol phosphate synthase TrpC [Bacteroidales bacterium]